MLYYAILKTMRVKKTFNNQFVEEGRRMNTVKAKELDLKNIVCSKCGIERNKDGNVYSESITGIKGKYSRASIGYYFPMHDCLNKEAYHMIVSLWIKKTDFDTRTEGPYYDFDTVTFYNSPHAGLLFDKYKPKTIAKLYTNKAIEIASN